MKSLIVLLILFAVGSLSEGIIRTPRPFHCTHRSTNVFEKRLRKFQCTQGLTQSTAEDYTFYPSLPTTTSEKKDISASSKVVLTTKLYTSTTSTPTQNNNVVSWTAPNNRITTVHGGITTIDMVTTKSVVDVSSTSTLGFEDTTSENLSTPITTDSETTIGKITTMVSSEPSSSSSGSRSISSTTDYTTKQTLLVTTETLSTTSYSSNSSNPTSGSQPLTSEDNSSPSKELTFMPASTTNPYSKGTSVMATSDRSSSQASTSVTGSSSISSTTDYTAKQTLLVTTGTVSTTSYSSESSNPTSGSQPLTKEDNSSPTKELTSMPASTTNPYSKGTSVMATSDRSSSQASTSVTVSTTQSTDSMSCPSNMIYTECSTCQKTCQNPHNCILNECSGFSCVCPEGFFLQGESCISKQECGCFFEQFVLADGSDAVNSDCSMKCVCTADQLVCDETYSCDSLATCGADDSGMMGCSCEQGYYGDGRTCQTEPTDCLDLYNSGTTAAGAYNIKPVGWTEAAFKVFCEVSDSEGPWLVFQRREDGATGFNQAWTAYQNGFYGTNDFWIGNEKLFYLTNEKQYELRIDFTNGNGVSYYVTYDSFVIGDSSAHYQLINLGTHGGNAADALRSAVGHAFSTVDSVNHDWSDVTCDHQTNGGWWYRPGQMGPCFASNLNGDWYGTTNTGLTWGEETKIKAAQMKLRPKQ